MQHRYRTRVDGNAWRPHDYDPNASWASVELTDGMTTEARLETRGFFDVTGEITDHGVPLAGAHMALLPGDRTRGKYRWFEFTTGLGSRFHVRSRVDGTFHFHVIPEGPYTLLVEHQSLSILARVRVDIERDLAPLELDLNSTTLEGTVTFPGNRPAGGAFVQILSLIHI